MHHTLTTSRASNHCTFICRPCRRRLRQAYLRPLHQASNGPNAHDRILENLDNASPEGPPVVRRVASSTSEEKAAYHKQTANESKSRSDGPAGPKTIENARKRRRRQRESFQLDKPSHGLKQISSLIANRSGTESTKSPPRPTDGSARRDHSEDTHLSLVDKILEARNRKPWGGHDRTKKESDVPPASYDSLRKADRISSPSRVLTSHNPHSFGLDPKLGDTVPGSQHTPIKIPPGEVLFRHNIHTGSDDARSPASENSDGIHDQGVDPAKPKRSSDPGLSVVGRVSDFFRAVILGSSSSGDTSGDAKTQDSVEGLKDAGTGKKSHSPKEAPDNPKVGKESHGPKNSSPSSKAGRRASSSERSINEAKAGEKIDSSKNSALAKSESHNLEGGFIDADKGHEISPQKGNSSKNGNSIQEKEGEQTSQHRQHTWKSKKASPSAKISSEKQELSPHSLSPTSSSTESGGLLKLRSSSSKAEASSEMDQTSPEAVPSEAASPEESADSKQPEPTKLSKREKKEQGKKKAEAKAKAAVEKRAGAIIKRKKRKERLAERKKELKASTSNLKKDAKATSKKSGAKKKDVSTTVGSTATATSSRSRRKAAPQLDDETDHWQPTTSLTSKDVEVTPLSIPQPPVPSLAHGLDRVLFNPGVYHLQDPSSRVYNFDPYLEKIMPVADFDFNSLREYKTSSRDEALHKIADEYQKKYIGSTSSMTSTLSHFHFLLSNWRPINLQMFSSTFVGRETSSQFTKITQAPSAIFLRYKDGRYAVDADKEFDNANVLMMLGKSMELLLTLPVSEFERYRKSDPRQITDEEKNSSDSYQYSTTGDFLLRSQLDAHDSRLPGTGVFDLKTRAVVSVRMQSKDYEPMTGYEIQSLQGKWTSYEREYYDMLRATALKYMLQARIGFMNGIFVAYHNVDRIFGFQFVPISDMDLALHGQTDPCLGDQEYKFSMHLFNQVLERATAKYPNTSLRVHTRTSSASGDNAKGVKLQMFVEPMTEEQVETIQNLQKAQIAEYEQKLMHRGSDEDQSTEQESAAELDEADVSDSATTTEPFTPEESNHNDPEMASKTRSTETLGNDTIEQTSQRDPTNNSSATDTDTDTDASLDDSLIPPELIKPKPLFLATIRIQNRVNGTRCERNRPKDLRPEDKWQVDYEIEEHESSPTVWAMYEDLKHDRKTIFSEARAADKPDEQSDPAEIDKSKERIDYYIQFLKGLANRGRLHRSRIDALDKGRAVVALGQPLPPASLQYRPAGVPGQVAIEGVEDYMGWLYGSKRV